MLVSVCSHVFPRWLCHHSYKDWHLSSHFQFWASLNPCLNQHLMGMTMGDSQSRADGLAQSSFRYCRILLAACEEDKDEEHVVEKFSHPTRSPLAHLSQCSPSWARVTCSHTNDQSGPQKKGQETTDSWETMCHCLKPGSFGCFGYATVDSRHRNRAHFIYSGQLNHRRRFDHLFLTLLSVQ